MDYSFCMMWLIHPYQSVHTAKNNPNLMWSLVKNKVDWFIEKILITLILQHWSPKTKPVICEVDGDVETSHVLNLTIRETA